jgi:hypothetical protein
MAAAFQESPPSCEISNAWVEAVPVGLMCIGFNSRKAETTRRLAGMPGIHAISATRLPLQLHFVTNVAKVQGGFMASQQAPAATQNPYRRASFMIMKDLQSVQTEDPSRS